MSIYGRYNPIVADVTIPTPRRRVLLEKLVAAQLGKELSGIYGT
jgi:hypothetical protein